MKWLKRLFKKKIMLERKARMSEAELLECFRGGFPPIKGVLELIDIHCIDALNTAGDTNIPAEKAQIFLAQFNALTNLQAEILDWVARAGTQNDG